MTIPRPARRSLLGTAAALALAGCSDGSDPAPAATSPGSGTAAAEPPPTGTPGPLQYRYGEHPRQVCDLWLPEGERRDDLLLVVHGGGWTAQYDRSDIAANVADLVARGWPVFNVDYRGVGDGGGWPSTFTDVASAIDLAARAADEHGLSLARPLVLGHSAGGHLAVWAAARRTLPPGAPGADPLVVPVFAASMAGVLNPTAIGGPGGDGNVTAVFGGSPVEVDDRYAVGDPSRRVPLGVTTFLVHGTEDGTVPFTQSQAFHDAAAAAGDDVRLELVEGVGHADPLDVDGATWPMTRAWIEEVLA